MSEHIHHVTDDTFEAEVLQAQQPVLVDYWAEWCGPCKMIAPILDEVAREYSGKLKVAKLNIDENQATPPKYGIRGIPTLMIFKNGSVEATKVGALSKSQLTAFIDSISERYNLLPAPDHIAAPASNKEHGRRRQVPAPATPAALPASPPVKFAFSYAISARSLCIYLT
jgi:thioredoxin 1